MTKFPATNLPIYRKPGIEEWLYWANLTVDHLTVCVHVYGKKTDLPTGVFMSDSERQKKLDQTVILLRRIHTLIDQAETPTSSVEDAHTHDEIVIGGIGPLFQDVLRELPKLSEDMQRLLQSPWKNSFPNKTAESLFLGVPDEEHGIGSGHPDHGRLPSILALLFEREQMGDSRLPRNAWLEQGEPRRHDLDGRQMWARHNSTFLRSAGRVD